MNATELSLILSGLHTSDFRADRSDEQAAFLVWLEGARYSEAFRSCEWGNDINCTRPAYRTQSLSRLFRYQMPGLPPPSGNLFKDLRALEIFVTAESSHPSGRSYSNYIEWEYLDQLLNQVRQESQKPAEEIINSLKELLKPYRFSRRVGDTEIEDQEVFETLCTHLGDEAPGIKESPLRADIREKEGNFLVASHRVDCDADTTSLVSNRYLEDPRHRNVYAEAFAKLLYGLKSLVEDGSV